MDIAALKTPTLTLPLAARPSAPQANPNAFPKDHVEVGHTGQDFVPPKIADMLAQAGKPYYDTESDTVAREKYYQGIDFNADPGKLFDQLGDRISRTHTETLAFKPLKYLHGWVDLRPNLRLQSIYSNEPVATNGQIHSTGNKDFVQKVKMKVPGYPKADGTVGERTVEKKVDFRGDAGAWLQTLHEGPTDALQIAHNIAMIEGNKFYNAEHSVPQSTFDRDKKPKGDLHHLFTCERNANSHRGAIKFGDVPKLPEHKRPEGWSTSSYDLYEPENGKGAVARATLYFLMHYPGKLGDKPGEYTKSDLETLIRWHKEDPVDLYELHRNAEIEKIQGNRNPLIDFPELADKVDFSKGLGAWGLSR